ncbi:putative TOS1-like glycosyl hydrolase-domain-containing protein [Echria macrotheca]|uniref:glucan endo-1,3-beta-D-glucosidase n=1 Tax=Echria macrotheca TaxID=438768 RepID=A0AAJ0FBD6_9PEZI|nr:putative TOS1-like glycosyl hydrolase-domain-containing protein [Echria macrotheca]
MSSQQLCAGMSFQEGGNWYCRPVDSITYTNVGTSGQYDEVVKMDDTTGKCETQPRSFSGPMAPFNEPMSLHFRGPLHLKQLAVYLPADKQKALVGACKASSPGFERAAYYHAENQAAEGLTFLGNFGGIGSGRFTFAFGNSLSYINANGTSGSPQSVVLADTLIPSGKEVIVMTDQKCDDSCGFVQQGSVGYKGFPSENRIILMDFTMPHTDDDDRPAFWMLNARIPHSAQYGCNCHASGCGEIDVFEVLTTGENKAKTAFHAFGSQKGGDSNYFYRPSGNTIRLAVVFEAEAGRIQVNILNKVQPDEEFRKALSRADVTRPIVDSDMSESVFPLAG